MCGIVGFIAEKKDSSLQLIRDMTDSLTHRGPDADGYYLASMHEYEVVLGHRRLSIIDVAEQSNQPMSFDHLTIVFNGEVYNFAAIRSELQAIGYQFDTAGDTEVILKAFHQWGIKSIDKFRGMFAFCIFDKKNQKTYLTRDRAGVKPLYFYHQDKTFIFSSEIKPFHRHPKFKKILCHRGLNLYFQHGYIAAPWTIFENLQKIRPGHYVEFDVLKNNYVEHQYWNLSNFYHLPKSSLDVHEMTEQLHEILKEAFSLRMIADVPVGVLLSGGIDSSLISSILQSHATQPLQTFTIGFDQKDYDESSYARTIANLLGTQHHEKVCTSQDAASIILNLPKMYDEPFADMSAIPTALLSQFTRQKVTVALSGDGGDEMFCGYTAYTLSEKRFEKINKLAFKKIVQKLLNILPDPIAGMYKINYDFYNRYLKLKSILTHGTIEDKYKAITRVFTSYDINKLLALKPYTSSINKFDKLSTIERMMLLDFVHYLPDDLLVKVDRATMYYSLEGREPLLDHKILEFAAQLPIEFKKDKAILKSILSKYLPASAFERKKQGFGIPINEWLRKDLNHLILRYFDKAKIIKQGIFNSHYVAKLCNAFMHSHTKDTRIWTLLMFQMWYEEYMDKVF